jgi:AraC-like DNA-binding protein
VAQGLPHASLRRRWLLQELLLIACDALDDSEATKLDTQILNAPGIAPALDLAFACQRHLTTADAARACHMSLDRFATVFRDLMAISFSQFVLRCRLGKAAEELRATDTPIKAVAAKCGFTDESHLHRLFVSNYRCTPAAYRAAH